MKEVPVHEAIGMTLCHDLTRVIPGVSKGRAFKKGHIIRNEDIPLLLDMGKEYIYVIETKDMIHEDDAAQRLARAAAGDGLNLSEPVEGKVNLTASHPGLLKINIDTLLEINRIDQIIFSTLHNNQWVPKNKVVAGTRIIPLLIEEAPIAKCEKILQQSNPLLQIKPLNAMGAAIVITGNEVYSQRIKDSFASVVTRKLEALGGYVCNQVIVPDDKYMIANTLKSLAEKKVVDMIIVTGGMSVDPDDRSPAAIKAAGCRIVSYGAPVLPGAMFLVAYMGNIPVLGLPACVIHAPVTIFDLILPRVLAGEQLSREDLIRMGHGGLCSNCPECHYPDCGFGK